MGYWDVTSPTFLMIALAVAALPWLDRKQPVVRATVLSVCLFFAIRYVAWRVLYTLPPVTDPLDFAVGVIFTTVEVASIVAGMASMVFLTRVRNRTQEVEQNLGWLHAQERQPLVDVLICTYNEEEPILERTIIGATSMAHPNYRVWVCDDGRRPWLKDLCERYDVGYLTRPSNEHAKAGNINAALKHLSALETPPDFVSILDADFVPFPHFLTRTLALMRDPDVGVVQTPQHFFNPDPIQANLALTRVYPDEQRFFFDVIMAAKDAWDGAFCCGTSSLIRFAPLRAIGGFPTDSVTEDYLVSLRLRQQGYRTVYLNEVLSLGLAPEGLAEYTGQRSRWCLGFVQICCGQSGPLWIGNNLPIVDRVMLIETFLYWSASHSFRVLGILVPALYLLFGIQAVHADVIDAIDYILPFFVAHIAAFAWLTEGRVLPVMSDLYQLLSANDVLKAVWSGLTKPKGQKFKVTAKGGDRSKRLVQWSLLRLLLLLMAMTVAAIVWAFMVDPAQSIHPSSGVALFWCWYNLVILSLACYVCIEQPRYRADERFNTNEPVVVIADNVSHMARAIDISVGGIQVAGKPPAPVGSQVRIAVGGTPVAGTIVRTTPDGFVLKFDHTHETHAAMVRRVLSGRYAGQIRAIRPGKVALSLAARMMR